MNLSISLIIILLFLLTFRIWIYLFLTIQVALWQYSRPKIYIEKEYKDIKDLTSSKKRKRGLFGRFISKTLSLMGGVVRLHVFWTAYIPSHHVRNFVYRFVYRAEIGKCSVIYYGAELRGPQLLHIGEGTIIGDKVTLDARRGGIFIGRFVRINSNVSMWTGSHDMNDPFFRSVPGKRGPIHIGDRVFIGPNVTILHSVNIGEGAVIAAGSIVTKDVEPFSIVAGVPAKKIGERSHNLMYTYPSSYSPFL